MDYKDPGNKLPRELLSTAWPLVIIGVLFLVVILSALAGSIRSCTKIELSPSDSGTHILDEAGRLNPSADRGKIDSV